MMDGAELVQGVRGGLGPSWVSSAIAKRKQTMRLGTERSGCP